MARQLTRPRTIEPAKRAYGSRTVGAVPTPADGNEFVGNALSQVGSTLFSIHSQMQSIFEREEVLKARDEGRKVAMTGTDAEGNPIFQPRPGHGLTQEAFNKAGEAVIYTRVTDALLQKKFELVDKIDPNNPDPDGFLKTWTAYTSGITQGIPAHLRPGLEKHANQLVLGTWLKLRNEKRRLMEKQRKAAQAAALARMRDQAYLAQYRASTEAGGGVSMGLVGDPNKPGGADLDASNRTVAGATKAAGAMVKGGAATAKEGAAYLRKMPDVVFGAKLSGHFNAANLEAKTRILQNAVNGFAVVKIDGKDHKVPLSPDMQAKLVKKFSAAVNKAHGAADKLRDMQDREREAVFEGWYRAWRSGDEAAGRRLRDFGGFKWTQRMDQHDDRSRRVEAAKAVEAEKRLQLTRSEEVQAAQRMIEKSVGFMPNDAQARQRRMMSRGQVAATIQGDLLDWADDMRRRGYAPGVVAGPGLFDPKAKTYDPTKWVRDRMKTIESSYAKLQDKIDALRDKRRGASTLQRRHINRQIRALRRMIRIGSWLRAEEDDSDR